MTKRLERQELEGIDVMISWGGQGWRLQNVLWHLNFEENQQGTFSPKSLVKTLKGHLSVFKGIKQSDKNTLLHRLKNKSQN